MSLLARIKRLLLPFEEPDHPLHYDHAAVEAVKQAEADEIDQLLREEGSFMDDFFAASNEALRTSGAKIADGKQTWEAFNDPTAQHDLALMQECMESELAMARKKKSYFPAPASAWRVAVMLRKQKNYAAEVEAIKAYCEVAATKNYEHNTTYTKLRERLPKAEAILAKQQQEDR